MSLRKLSPVSSQVTKNDDDKDEVSEAPHEEWTVEDTSRWIKSLGEKYNSKETFTHYAKLIREHKINGDLLITLDQSDLHKMGIKLVGDQKYILNEIINLQKADLFFFNFQWNTADDAIITMVIKLVATGLYLTLAVFCTALTMVLVHYRVPEQGKYPPLPDIILDNVPLIPKAFIITEYILTALMTIMLLVVIFHKHRLVVLRRILCITATTFLMRSVTMYVTSLSVPGTHLECSYFAVEPSFEDKLQRALEITKGLGLSINGVQTCGDYMFSGHTVMLTILNYGICYYTPRRYRELHTFTWILNVFGMFFILAAHEHYTLDVIVAFYVTSRLFLYYHEALHSGGAMSGATFFPLYTYLEENTSDCKNEYEMPYMPLVRFVLFIRHYRKQKQGEAPIEAKKPIIATSAADIRKSLSSTGHIADNLYNTTAIRRSTAGVPVKFNDDLRFSTNNALDQRNLYRSAQVRFDLEKQRGNNNMK